MTHTVVDSEGRPLAAPLRSLERATRLLAALRAEGYDARIVSVSNTHLPSLEDWAAQRIRGHP